MNAIYHWQKLFRVHYTVQLEYLQLLELSNHLYQLNVH